MFFKLIGWPHNCLSWSSGLSPGLQRGFWLCWWFLCPLFEAEYWLFIFISKKLWFTFRLHSTEEGFNTQSLICSMHLISDWVGPLSPWWDGYVDEQMTVIHLESPIFQWNKDFIRHLFSLQGVIRQSSHSSTFLM